MNSTTNKERGYYWVTYTCINCGWKIDKKVDFGKSIPTLTTDKKSIEAGRDEAPECSRCGCFDWSYGKAQ